MLQLVKDLNPVTDEHAIGLRIKMLRTQSGMTQKQLAELLGVKFQQLQKYENGTNRVSASRLNAIMGIFKVSWDYFFKDQPTTASFYGAGFADNRAPFNMSEDDASLKEGRGEEAINAIYDILGTNDGAKLVRAFARVQDVEKRKLVINLAESLATPE